MANDLTALFNLGLNLSAIMLFLLMAGGEPRRSWLELPLFVAALAVLAPGVGILLAALGVRYRNRKPSGDVALQVLFYASPVFDPIDVVLKRDDALRASGSSTRSPPCCSRRDTRSSLEAIPRPPRRWEARHGSWCPPGSRCSLP